MSDTKQSAFDWNSFSFDEEVVLDAIPRGTKTSAIHVSIAPKPAHGGVCILGKMANGGTGSITLHGNIFAAKLPFEDRVIRLQYLGGTRSVDVHLESFARK